MDNTLSPPRLASHGESTPAPVWLCRIPEAIDTAPFSLNEFILSSKSPKSHYQARNFSHLVAQIPFLFPDSFLQSTSHSQMFWRGSVQPSFIPNAVSRHPVVFP
jgi:hypothetical protein